MLKQAGYEIYCYTPNDPKEVMKDFEAWGVDMLITDVPDIYQQNYVLFIRYLRIHRCLIMLILSLICQYMASRIGLIIIMRI